MVTNLKQNVSLDLLGPCNYSCPYCIGDGPANPYPKPILHDLGKLAGLYRTFVQRGEVMTTMLARGSEPALHPQMAEIARICTTAGVLHCSTNMSRPVSEWLSGPHNLWLLVTIHPEAEADLPGFMARIRNAVDQGYDVQVQALGPEDRPDWRTMLVEAGVTRPFYVRKIRVDARWRAQNTEITPAPAGTLCRGGYNEFYITPETSLRRCQVNRWEGGPYDTPMPCPMPMADSRCVGYLIEA